MISPKISLWFVLACASLFALCGCSKAGAQDQEVRMRYQVALHGQDCFLLLPGNLIVEGLPTGGLDGFDYNKAKAASPQYCGTYTMKGDKMIIIWGGGRAPVTWGHVVTPNGQEEMDGAMWMKGFPFAPGQRLDVHYHWSGISPTSTATASVSTASDLIFRPDGTFTQTGTGAVRFTGPSSASQVAQHDRAGTYEVSGYTLTLTGQNGTATRHTFVMEGKPTDLAKPSIVVYDGAMMFPAR